MRLLSRAQQQALDQYLVDKGIPLMLLMEAAGTAVADAILEMEAAAVGAAGAASAAAAHASNASAPLPINLPINLPIDLLVGPGMNGGDLYVAARKLASASPHRPVSVWEPAREAKGLVGEMRGAALAVGIRPEPLSEYKPRCAIVVDGLLGTGFDPGRALSAELALALQKLALTKAAGSTVVACDLPSGVVADTGEQHPLAVAADETVSFFAPKIGQMMSPACQLNGHLRISSLGLPASLVGDFWAFWDGTQDGGQLVTAYETSDLRTDLWQVRTDTHKGTQGYLLMVAGSAGMAGAARLAAEAALRAGTGLIRLVCDRACYPELFAALPSLLFAVPPSDEWLPSILPFQAKATALLLGPGLGRGERTATLLKELLTWDQPLVIDADALYELAGADPEAEALRASLRSRNAKGFLTILTPHGGEAARLASAYNLDWDIPRLAQAKALARAASCWIVLKGEATLIASPDVSAGDSPNASAGDSPNASQIFVNTTGGPGLAKGGSGDILAGLLAALLAQKLPPEIAAPAAVCWHGAAADFATRSLGWRSLTPMDTLAALPGILD